MLETAILGTYNSTLAFAISCIISTDREFDSPWLAKKFLFYPGHPDHFPFLSLANTIIKISNFGFLWTVKPSLQHPLILRNVLGSNSNFASSCLSFRPQRLLHHRHLLLFATTLTVSTEQPNYPHWVTIIIIGGTKNWDKWCLKPKQTKTTKNITKIENKNKNNAILQFLFDNDK